MSRVICDDDRNIKYATDALSFIGGGNHFMSTSSERDEPFTEQDDENNVQLTTRYETPWEHQQEEMVNNTIIMMSGRSIKSKSKRNKTVVMVWGKAKRLYKPMTSIDLDRFDVHQNRTKKEYHDDVLTNRTRYASSLVKLVQTAKHNFQYSITQGASSFDRALEAVDSRTRFNLVFPEINIDQYQGAYRCRLIVPDDTHVYSGQCFVCTDYICFYVESIDNLFEQVVPLKISCPFVYVQKITKASKIVRGSLVEVVPMATDLKPSVIQLWTTDEKVHQFTSFGTNFDSVFFKMTNLYRLHTLV